ncbi:MAG: hypothetical protein AB7T74_10775 [Clostridia bacterium]
MEKSTLRRADLLFSIALMLGSLWFMVQSIKLFLNPFGRKWEAVPADSVKDTLTFWYKSPALMPFFVSLLVLLCSVMLFHVAMKSGARIDFIRKEKIAAFLRNREFQSFVIITLLLCIYAFVLIPVCGKLFVRIRIIRGFPFFVATFIYLLSMMIAFGHKRLGHVLRSLLVAFLASGFVTYAFGTLAKIPLP